MAWKRTSSTDAPPEHRSQQGAGSTDYWALLLFAFSAARLFTVRGDIISAITLPLATTLLTVGALSGGGESDILCQLAPLAEIAWTTQNLFQLPSYRHISDMHPATFAFADYMAQMVPYYLLSWALSSSGALPTYLAIVGVSPMAFGIACLAVLVSFCVFAMARHALKYLPSTPSERRNGAAPSPIAASETFVPGEAGESGLESLTPREHDVFVLFAAGYSRSYIAKVLCISPETVKVHTRHIYSKLGISSKDELIALAHEEQAEAEACG